MIAFCDIGNTNTKIILMIDRKIVYKIVKSKKFLYFVKKHKQTQFYISCVVTEVENQLKKMGKKVKIITHDDIKGLKVKYNIQNLGIDRLLSVFAAKKIIGDNVLIISCGTTIVADYIDRKGIYVGGQIFPGILSSVKSLSLDTSKLPLVKKQDVFSQQRGYEKFITGNDTKECIMKGIINFYISGIMNLIKKLKPKNVIFTGGDAQFFIQFFANKSEHVYEIKNLVLLGIVLWCYQHGLITKQQIVRIYNAKIFGKTIDIKRII